MAKKMSQKELVLDHIKGEPITPLDALQLYGCFRLAAVIHELRKDGWKIVTEDVTDKRTQKTFAKYHLIKDCNPSLGLLGEVK